MLTSSTRSPQIHKSTSLNPMTLDLTWSPRSPQLYRLPTPCCSSTWSVWFGLVWWSTDLDNFADLKITGGVTRVAGGRGGERLRLVLLLRGEANKDSTLTKPYWLGSIFAILHQPCFVLHNIRLKQLGWKVCLDGHRPLLHFSSSSISRGEWRTSFPLLWNHLQHGAHLRKHF